MKEYSYKDVKLLRQVYKSSLEQLYEAASAERAQRMLNILTVASATMDVPGFAQELNASGEQLLTASLEIFRVKCGPCREFVGERLANAIDLLLFQFTKRLKNYTRKVKEMKLEVDLLEFYRQVLPNEDLFPLYASYFKIVLPKLLPRISSQSNIESAWADLISSLVGNLKRTDNTMVVSKCVAIATAICSENPIFCKEFVKNGVLLFLLNFVEKCEERSLVVRCLELLALLSGEKQLGQLLVQQHPEEVFVQVQSRFLSSGQLTNRIKVVMDNIIKFSEPQPINAVLEKAKQQCKEFAQNRSDVDSLTQSLEYLKLYSLSNGFAKYLSKSEAHKWLTPLLTINQAEAVHSTVLDVIGSMLNNKEAFRNSEDIFNGVCKPLLDALNMPRSSVYLQQYLRVLATALRKDIIGKDFIKKHGLIELVEHHLKEDHPPACIKTVKEVMTLIGLKEGRIKHLPLEVNRRNKELKELEAVNTYLDTILTMGLYEQVRRQQLDTLSQFLNVQQSDYPNDNEEEVQALAQAVFAKFLRLLSAMFTDVKVIETLASGAMLDGLIAGMTASPDLKQSLDLLEIVLVANPTIKFNKDNCQNMLLNIHRANPLNEHVVASCGEIMFHLGSQQYVREALKNFTAQAANVGYLEQLALNMCTLPDAVSEEDLKIVDKVAAAISQQPIHELAEELAQNLLIVLVRTANASESYRVRLRANAQLIAKVEQCFEKPHLKPYVLEFFTALSKPLDGAVHRSSKAPVDRSHLRPIEDPLGRLQKKVLDDNSYSVPELRFLERLALYDSKPISEKIKIKNAQAVVMAGQLFAHALEESNTETKKAPSIIEELNKELSLRNRNIINILKFFNALRDDDHYADLQKLLEMSKELCGMKPEDYILYPVRHTLLQLCLDCLAQNLNKTKEIADMAAFMVLLERTLKIFEQPSDPTEVCNKKSIVGAEDIREQVIESIYNCMDAIAGVDTVRVRPTDHAVKYVEGSCNPYVVQTTANMLNKVVQDEGCSETRRRLKEHVNKKFPALKAQIQFEPQAEPEKPAEKQPEQVAPAEQPTQPSPSKVETAAKQPVKVAGSGNKTEQRPSRPTKTVIESSITRTRKETATAPPAPPGVDMSKMSVQVATKKVEELVALKEVVPPPDYFISRVVDALRQDKSEKADQLLAKLYIKYIKLQEKLCQQDAEALNRIIVRIQQTRTTTECIVEILESTVEIVEVTEKIKLLGERALMYAIRIFPQEPAYAAKIIEYNLVSERQLQIVQRHKIPEQALALMKRSLQNPDIDKYVCMLVGTTAKSKTMQEFYVKNEMHLYVLEALRNNRRQPKIVANCFYAMAGLTFCLQQMTNLIATPDNTKLFLQLIKDNQKSSTVVESGCCLISNLCYRNEQAKKIYFNCGVVESVLELFRLQLQAKEYRGSVFKQMLRVLGNCSLLLDNAKKMVAKDYVPLSIQLIELVNYNQDLEVLRYIIEVLSNLSSHTDNDFKMYLATMFKQGILDMLITLLETQLLNAEIIAACIDSIDGLCQDKEVERYAVEKRLIRFLLDILKSHEWNEKIVMKAVRVLSNLTLDREFIVKIMEANVPSVLANVLSNRKLEKSKLSLYRMKIISRVFNAKIKTDLVMRSGYIDCVLESLKKQTEMYLEHVEILLFYAKDMSEFMSKKTFQIIVPVLEKNLADETVCNKIVVLLKLIDRDTDVEAVMAPLSRIYMHLTSLPEKEVTAAEKLRMQELLNLLVGYCARCPNLKELLRERRFVDALQLWKKKTIDDEDFLSESIMVCTVVILNEYIPKQVSGVTRQESEDFLKKGLHCKLFRRDSTFKRAIVCMTPEYELRSYKFPDGEVKDKYRMHVLNVKDACFRYEPQMRLWDLSVFSHSGGLFEKKADPKLCCTIIGPVTKVGAVMLNLEFETEGMKNKLEEHLFNLIRFLREK